MPPDTARIAAQYDLSAFDNLVTIDGSAGADVVDVKLYGNTDGDRANGEFGVTTAREIQARALKAIYGQSYVPSEDELIPVDSPDNETFGWLTGFGGNSQGIVLDNNELVRIQLGNASNNMILSGVDRDIEYVVLSMGGGDDTVRVGAMSEIVDRISMLKTNLADYSVEVQDWFIDEIAEADRDKVLKQAAYDEVEATAAALEAWYAGLDVSGIDTALLATDLAEQQRLNGKFIADLDPALRDWFTGYESVLARINATAQDLYSQALVDAKDLDIDETRSAEQIITDLDAWFAAINFREFADNLPALQAKWERANPRHAGHRGFNREHPVAGADHRRHRPRYDLDLRHRARRGRSGAGRCLLGQAVPACRPLGGDVRTDRGRPAAAAHRLYPNSLLQPVMAGRARMARSRLNSFENSYVYLGAANDKVEVKAALQPIGIYTGGGDDDIFIGSTPDDALTSTLDGIDTIVTIDGGLGSTRLVVSRGGDTDDTGTVSIGEGEVILQHFAGNDRAQPPIVSAVAYQTLVDPTFNDFAAVLIAGSYKSDKDNGFDRGVTVYTGDGDDKSVQIKSIRPEAPTRIYLGKGDDIASVLPTLDEHGNNIGLRQLSDPSKDPHDKLEVFGGDGNDRIDLSKALVNVRAFGGAGNDRLIGSTGFDILIGGDGDDWIEGYGSTLLGDPARRQPVGAADRDSGGRPPGPLFRAAGNRFGCHPLPAAGLHRRQQPGFRRALDGTRWPLPVRPHRQRGPVP